MITEERQIHEIIDTAVENNLAYLTYNDNVYVEAPESVGGMVQIHNLKDLLTLINV